MPKDEISDGYCDSSIENSIQQLKVVGVSGFDIIRALNRAILKLERQKREGK